MKVILMAVAIASVLSSCAAAQAPPCDLLNKENALKIEIYDHGSLSRQLEVLGSSIQIKKIQVIINCENRKWRGSQIDYAPEVLIKGSFGSVNFQKNRIIINFKDANGDYKQVVSHSSSKELKEVKSILVRKQEGKPERL